MRRHILFKRSKTFLMYFILSQANLELFKLLKSKEFPTPHNPRWKDSEPATSPHPTPQFSFVFASRIPFLNWFYDRTTLDSLFRPLVLAAICVNRFSSCITLWYIALFTFSFFLSKILRIPDNGEKKFKGFSLL